MTFLCTLLFGKHRSKLAVGIAGLVVAAKALMVATRLLKQKQHAAMLSRLEKDVVHIFCFPRWSRGPNISSPCFRVECFLRLARIPYKVHFTMDASCSPTERLPYMVYNGTVLADSEFIAKWAYDKFNSKVDSHLTPEQHAVGLATRRLVEGSLQQGSQRMNVVDHPERFVELYKTEAGVPRFVAAFFVRKMRKQYINMLNAVGHGDLTDAQYKSEMMRDYKALEALIGDKPFLLGDEITSYDCNIYAHLQVFIALNINTPEFEYLRSSKILRSFSDRMGKALFPDMDVILSDEARKAATQTFGTDLYPA